MLNYIWAGLIIISVCFALWQDGGDFVDNRFRNGDALPVQIVGLYPEYEGSKEPVPVTVIIRPDDYMAFYNPAAALGIEPGSPEETALYNRVRATFGSKPMSAVFKHSEKVNELHIQLPTNLPPPLDVLCDSVANDENQVQAKVSDIAFTSPAGASAGLTFPHVNFVKTKEVSATMFDQADNAVMFAIGLMGVIALWMGLMKIAEDAGLVNLFVKLVRPVLGPLFPQIPKDHPALGLIAVNLAANMLALGNAATPLGIKAMESLQELNKEKDTATDSMVMLLAMNTASVQLLPPVTLIAILGLGATELFLPIFLVTAVSLVVAIVAAKSLGRMRRFRETDPMRPNNPNADSPEPEKGGAA